ncbi:MAG: hypothetical protein IJR82_05000 [Bacilli bacterium]|nr:hypothetical protein [Bacilli bacterium]
MKKNKNLVILLLVAVIGIVGVTIAYFSSRATFENEFQTSEYGATYIEKFTSPDNWLPGDVTEKTLEVRNSGTVDEAVRVKVEESWISKNGTTLPLKQGDNVAADIHWINEDDWTKVTVDGEDYYYYYYNYKLAPEETTSKLLDKVTFNPLINATASCSDTVVDGVLRRTCNSSGAGYDGATYKLKFTIETVQYNKYAEAWGTGNTIILLDEKPEPPKPASEYLAENATNAANAEYNNDTKGKMFYFSHKLNEGTEDEKTITETRYIGEEPNNYVYFNCDDMDNQSASTCEVWRIIGVFDVERNNPENQGQTITETRMKLVRGSSFATEMTFHGTDYSSAKNDWTISDLKTFLNGDYYNRSGDAVTYGLKASARSIIDDAKYYLGAFKEGGVTTEQLYANERGTTVCGACSSDTTKLTWIGKVGLMYPSDEYMVYGNGVNDTCYTKPNYCRTLNGGLPETGWVYKSNVLEGQTSPYSTAFLSSRAGTSTHVLYVHSDGNLSNNLSYISHGVRPVVYLKSDIKITDGDGSKGSPYKLKKIQ